MSATVTLEDAQARLKELVAQLAAGDEIVITDNDRPIARLVSDARPLRQLGTMKGTVLYMAPDFDAPLEDFKEYME
jgi:prevent-host-death family protein